MAAVLGGLDLVPRFATISLACLVALPATVKARREGPDAALLVIGLITGVIAFFFVIGFFGALLGKRSERRKYLGRGLCPDRFAGP